MTEEFPPPKGPFAFTWAEEERVGEDLTFCVRVKNAGFPIFVDCRIQVGHVKPVILDLDYYEHWAGYREWHRQQEENRASGILV